MKVFDLSEIAALPYEQRDKNVFYQTKEFKTRIIELSPGGQMPTCEMASHVIFYGLGWGGKGNGKLRNGRN
jgi:hypothetical protein